MRIIIVVLSLLAFVLALPALATLTCESRLGACQGGYVDVFKISNLTDAHGELRNESFYNYTVCCNETYSVPGSLGTSCSSNYNRIILNLSSSTNAHAMMNNETRGYSVPVCISSTSNISFGYDTSCAGFDSCIASVSGNTNAHIGNCTAYSTLLCVQTRNITVNITEGNRAVVATRGYQTQNLTVTFYDQALDIYPENVSGRIWVNKNGAFVGFDCTSDVEGNCTIKFDPDCSFPGGTTTWRGGIFNDDAYRDRNSTNGTLTIDVEPSCTQTVSFQLEFNISGTGGDSSEVDGRGAGFYKSNDTTNYYSCIQDTGVSNTPTFGIVFAGTELDYINLTSGQAGGSSRMRMSQFQSNNRFIIPVTINGCGTIVNRMPSIRQGLLTQPFVAFVSLLKNPLQIILSYPDLDVIGDFSKSGTFTLTLEKNETNRITQIIVRES